MLFKSKTFDPGIVAYPVDVLDPNDEIIGNASTSEEYAVIWNSNSSNSKTGRLYPKDEYNFTLVTSGIGCCSCSTPIAVIIPGCGGSGTVVEPHLNNLTSIVGGGETWDPVAGSTVLTLPSNWEGRRIMIFRNGLYFTDYTRTSTGIVLTREGDVFSADGIEPEKIVTVNY